MHNDSSSRSGRCKIECFKNKRNRSTFSLQNLNKICSKISSSKNQFESSINRIWFNQFRNDFQWNFKNNRLNYFFVYFSRHVINTWSFIWKKKFGKSPTELLKLWCWMTACAVYMLSIPSIQIFSSHNLNMLRMYS